MRVDVIRDVLDKQLLDAHRQRIGKVDGLVLELPQGKAPRVAALRVGSRAWAHRLGRPIERLVGGVSRWFWGAERAPWEIPWSAVEHLGKSVQIVQEAARAPELDWERWLGERVIGRIPGADR